MHNILKSLYKAVAITVLGCAILGGGVSANVGEGDLPEGAMAFSKILKYQVFLHCTLLQTVQTAATAHHIMYVSLQDEWKKLYQVIDTRRLDLTVSELSGAKIFLKELAREYDDMVLLATGIQDPDKATEARSIAKEFRTKVRQCDDAASQRDLDAILTVYPQTAALMERFLVLLQDVPADL